MTMFDDISPHPLGEWYKAAVNNWKNVIPENMRDICDCLKDFSKESLTEIRQGDRQVVMRTETKLKGVHFVSLSSI